MRLSSKETWGTPASKLEPGVQRALFRLGKRRLNLRFPRVQEYPGEWCWGFRGLSDPRANPLILVCVLAILAFAVSSYGGHNIQSFLLSALISILIVLLFLRNASNQSVLPIGILFVMFGVVCMLIALNAHRMMIEAIRLRISNERLAEQRTQEARREDRILLMRIVYTLRRARAGSLEPTFDLV